MGKETPNNAMQRIADKSGSPDGERYEI